jgi:hypothetical protein
MHCHGLTFREALHALLKDSQEAQSASSATKWAGEGRSPSWLIPGSPTITGESDARFKLAMAARIVRESRPLIGTLGELHLSETRAINCDAIIDILRDSMALRWHPRLRFSEPGHPRHGEHFGALIGVMSNPETAKPTGGISRTYLDPNGNKIGKAKGLGPAGIVRLSPDEEVCQGLHLAEGLETALAGMEIGLRPMWSTGSTSLMRSFPVLRGVESLTLIADHDENGAGLSAAREAASRWRSAGCEARVLLPNDLGDLNDRLRERRK